MFPKVKLLAVFGITLLAIGMMIPGSSLAASNTQTFTPVADAYINQSTSTTNYGSNTSLRIDGSPLMRTYLRFNLTGLSSYTVSTAVLKIYANSSLSAGFSVIRIANNNWLENTLNYNNAPALGTVIKSSGPVSSGSWTSMDITPYITGNGNYSLAFVPLSDTALNLASKESGAHAPQLIVTLTASGTVAAVNSATPTKNTLATGTRTPTPTVGTKTSTPQAATKPSTPTSIVSAGQVPNFSHVVVMIFENREASSVIGSSTWPNLNNLAKKYASLTSYYAVSHPSLPNYLAIVSGSTQGITSDCTTCYVNATNIADSVENSGRTFKGYMESMPSACYVGSSGNYAQKHDPFVYFDDMRNNATRCKNDVVPLTQLDTDLANNHLPAFAWITPNLCNDAHDCSNTTADNFLNTEVNKILSSPSFDQNSLLVITFDEGSSSASCCGLPSSAGGKIVTILISGLVKPGYQDATPYSHYSLLKTIEKAWSLPYLVHAADTATTLITSPWR